ncbi:hypothetical protein GCM10023336_77470 [Streptomyces similanensis]|uniref:Glyoxalase-like domain-containing protein n=1 Tax=Streptomyces similanensis TaxID=1274988 RepID=A0ABP9LT03_9ACTN
MTSRPVHDREDATTPGLGAWCCPRPPGRGKRAATVVVHTPTGDDGRRVSVRDEVVGVVRNPDDVIRLVRRLGVDLETEEIGRTPLIEWRGGGPCVWRIDGV